MKTNAYMLTALQNDFAAKSVNETHNANDIVAAMLLQVVHCDWEANTAQREKLLEVLTSGPELDAEQADDLLRAASFLLHFYVADGFSKLLRHSKQRFSKGQKTTVIRLMEELAHMDGLPNPKQKKLIEQTMQTLA